MKITWNEYSEVLKKIESTLKEYLTKNNIKITTVVPILRGAGVLGTFLAYKFDVKLMTPVQYQFYLDKNKIKLRRIFDIKIYKKVIGKNPIFLLAENNHCYGVTAHFAAKDIKKAFPYSRIIYVADFIDASYIKNDYAETIIYGTLTNESRTLSEVVCKEKGLINENYSFPWEDIHEEHFSFAEMKRKLGKQEYIIE